MPLLTQFTTHGATLAIWQTTETVDSLSQMLPPTHPAPLQAAQFHSESRQREYLAARVLLQAVRPDTLQIAYHPTGRPYIVGGKCNISVSHTHGSAAVLLSETHTPGIDIETISPRINPLKDRFVCPDENCRTTLQLLLNWSAKETAYKILDTPGIDFKTMFHIENMPADTPEEPIRTAGCFDLQYHIPHGHCGTLLVNYRIYPRFVLTYSLASL